MRNFIILLSLMQFQFAICQNKKLLQGVWIKSSTNHQTGVDSKLDVVKLKYTFADDILYISTNNSVLGTRYEINIKGNKIELPYYTLLIEAIGQNELTVVELQNGENKPEIPRINFVREDKFLENIDLKNCSYYLNDADTIYKKSDFCYATSKNSPSNFTANSLHKTLEDDGFVYATYVIDENGSVVDVKVLHHINKSSDHYLKKLILKTDGMWTPHLVSSKYIKIQDHVRMAKNVMFSTDYMDKFVLAMSYVELNLLEKAIVELRQCRSMTNEKSNIDFHLYTCYAKMGRNSEAELHKGSVLKSELAYLVD